jgi:hypothetical protein
MRRGLGILALTGAMVAGTATPALADCTQGERIGGECSSVTTISDGSEVTIGLTRSNDGSPGTAARSSTSSNGFGTWSPPPIRQEAELGSSECELKLAGLCRAQAPAKPTAAEKTEATPPTPPSHASQLKGFRPDTPSIAIEPSAWSLPTLAVNIYARAERHRVNGELLGWPVVVRFTPVAFHWNYGDGTGRSLTSAGSSLSAQGKQQFDATQTSHVYRRPGVYTVSLQVDYRVEFQFDGGSFRDIKGVVSARASSRAIEVLTVSPLLEAD